MPPDLGIRALARRSTQPERMDAELTEYEDYQRCLADLARVNRLTFTHRATLAWLRRQAAALPAFSLLDVACGHGDFLRAARRWARRAGKQAWLVGLDRHPWSARAARAATAPEDAITYITADVFAFHPETKFDFIVSSQFLHHLSDEEAASFLAWQEAHAARGWFVSDLHRHALAYLGFPILATAARWHELVRWDGRVSIARSFRPSELRALAAVAGLRAEEVTVRWHPLFRLGLGRVKN
ncbi:MAG TPA: methyltransferase domain-containing protein [Acetobacteraceae bacterium]|nr:methyltransferase domain-containing protein [Acetobacteraceae bacterium]